MCPGLPWRSCTWSASSSSSNGSPPQSATWPVSTSSRTPGTSSRNARTVSTRVHDRARPRLEQRVRRGAATTAPRAPTCRRPSALGAGVEHHPSTGFGNDGRAPDRQRERRRVDAEQRVDVREAVGAPRPATARRCRRAARRRRRRRRAARRIARTIGRRMSRSCDFGMTMPTCCRCWPRPLSKCSATSAASSRRPSTSTRSASGAGRACTRTRCGPRIWPFTCAACSDARNATSGAFERRVLLGRRLLARPLVQRGGHPRRARGRHRVHRDAVAAELHRPDERHAHDPGLGRAVVRLAEVAAQPGRRRDVDDAAVALLLHHLGRVPGAVERALQVHGDDRVEVGSRPSSAASGRGRCPRCSRGCRRCRTRRPRSARCCARRRSR